LSEIIPHLNYQFFALFRFRYGKPVELTEEFIRNCITEDMINIYTGDEFLDVTKDELVESFMADKPKQGLLEGIALPSNASPEFFPIPNVCHSDHKKTEGDLFIFNSRCSAKTITQEHLYLIACLLWFL
jgi:hypothetical protein